MTQPSKRELEQFEIPNTFISGLITLFKMFGPWVFSWVVLGFLWVSYERKNVEVTSLANSVIAVMGTTNKSISDLTSAINDGHERIDTMLPTIENLRDEVKANGKQIDLSAQVANANNDLLHELNGRAKQPPQPTPQ